MTTTTTTMKKKKKKPYFKVNNQQKQKQKQQSPAAEEEKEEGEEEGRAECLVISVTAILLLIAVACAVVVIRRLTSGSGSGSIRGYHHLHLISRVCESARFPDTCAVSVGAYTRAVDASTPRDVVAISMIVGFQGVSASLELVERLYAAENNDSFRAPLKDCLDLLSDALDRINSSIVLFFKATDDRVSASENADIQTWLSSALTLQDTCAMDGFQGVVGSAKDEVLSDGMHVQKLLRNSLSLAQVFASLGNDFSDWKKKPSSDRH